MYDDWHAQSCSLALHEARTVHRQAESARQKRGTHSARVEIAMARCEIGYGLKRRRERCFHGIRKRGCASVTFAGVDGRLHAPRNALDYILYYVHALLSLPLDCVFVYSTHNYRKRRKKIKEQPNFDCLNKQGLFTWFVNMISTVSRLEYCIILLVLFIGIEKGDSNNVMSPINKRAIVNIITLLIVLTHKTLLCS